MSEKPWRRFLQIHLSTAIVLMFAAGLILWLNMRVVATMTAYLPNGQFELTYYGKLTQYKDGNIISDWEPHTLFVGRKLTTQGWPCRIKIHDFDARFIEYKDFNDGDGTTLRLPQTSEKVFDEWSWNMAAADVGIALAVLLLVAIVCEAAIWRREARKP